MARINTNISSLVAQSNLARSNRDLEGTLQRLATGLRINRGGDDPAGLITSERIGADLAGIEQAITNGERARSVIATTEASLAEVNNLLLDIKRLTVEAANTGGNSQEERDAAQLQIDSAIESITRISNTSSFGGLRLLDGSLDYITSGISPTAISKARVNGASLIGSGSLQVDVDVVGSAQNGRLFLQPNVSPLSGAALQSTVTLTLTGNRGVQEVSFTSGQTLTQIRDAINNLALRTGVEAELINGNASSGLVFKSQGFGAESFVSVQRADETASSASLTLYKLSGDGSQPTGSPFGFAGLISGGQLTEAGRDEGRDVQALINGTLAKGRGLRASLSTPSLAVDLDLGETFATSPAGTIESFNITGGGSLFQLGPEVSALQQTNIGIQSMSATELGGTLTTGGVQFLSSLASGGANDIVTNNTNRDFTSASDIIDAAIDEVTLLRGRLGAFEGNVLETNTRSLQSAFENLTASRSLITDADFAAESSALTRAQILQTSGTSVLGLANQSAQSVLQLLG